MDVPSVASVGFSLGFKHSGICYRSPFGVLLKDHRILVVYKEDRISERSEYTSCPS